MRADLTESELGYLVHEMARLEIKPSNQD
jgi:hypothetical protein